MPTPPAQARRGLLIFFPVLIAGTAYFEHRILSLGGDIGHHIMLIVALMWWVTVASIVARVANRESPRDISFRWGGSAGTRAVLVATVLPLVVGLVAYGISWSTGLAHFTTPARGFTKFLLYALTVGGIVSCSTAAGEEIGWRGYMLTRLVDSGLPFPILCSGIIWGLWHTPLILSGQYASGPHPLASATVFVCMVVGLGFIFAWLRLSSGSIWPCIWAHGVWNAVIQGPFDQSTAGYSAWVGESGILTTIVVAIFAVVLYRIWPLPARGGANEQPLAAENVDRQMRAPRVTAPES
jgi:membrane protease YdiL (CAAX protease family)